MSLILGQYLPTDNRISASTADSSTSFQLHITKLMFLQSIQPEISDASVSETMPQTIPALDLQGNIRTTYSMKAAVAVDCTVKYLALRIIFTALKMRFWMQRLVTSFWRRIREAMRL
ncbi:hypothetical protein CFOL_v3_08874 [Cephalotus follicularis]|uniref:Uncharacterized protein n=1 Tax=Cephalotus follicularis TaxID=3775 RepID=A0A1Q3BBR6_CEPFO|nr:hypothetical protein CFOL_v3_08874 [Cephalotus follicularis]